MPNDSHPALTPEQWEAKDYRQPASDLDRWAKRQPGASGDDATEYVAKVGLSDSGSVVVMTDHTTGSWCRRQLGPRSPRLR